MTNISETTLTVEGAATLLHMHPDSVRRKAANYELPHAKIGGKLIFIESDIIMWLRSQYREQEKCHSSSVMAHGISTLHSKGKECAALLAPNPKARHRN